HKNDDGASNAGAAYLVLASHYVEISTVPLDDAYRVIRGTQIAERLGFALAGAGNVGGDSTTPDIVVGAYAHNTIEPDDGLVGVFFDGGDTPDGDLEFDDADTLLHGATNGELAGYSLSFVDDMDGDGLNELLVGAPRFDGPVTWSGAAYLVTGADISGGGTLDLDDSNRIEGEAGRAGDKVKPAGDIDGDGIIDLLIAAPHNSTGGTKAGRVYVVYGDGAIAYSTLMLADADIRITGESPRDEAGTAIEGNFDADGDGTADIMIGSPYNSDTASESGRAYVLWGSGLGSDELVDLGDADVVFTSDDADANLGYSVSSAGDMNTDGMDELLIGIPKSNRSSPEAGAAALFDASDLTDGGIFTIDDSEAAFYGTARDHLAGTRVLGLGDVNGDTFPDIAISEPDDSTLGTLSGAVRILFAP
ncbi:MAG: integrin alpha, partial [Myxococcota bacterium]